MSEASSVQKTDICESVDDNKLGLDSTSTNEMGEVINQGNCFEKQSNGDINKKELLEKDEKSNDIVSRLTTAETECEKYKSQFTELKKDLKILRHEKEAEIKQLKAAEEAFKNEIKELKIVIKQYETKLKELQQKEVKLADNLTSKTHSELQISRAMDEYEKSISGLVAENQKIKKERDTAQMHLANIEIAFSDVHQKYERCKQIIQGYKDNEDSFRQDIAMSRETIANQEQKYVTLKAHAMTQMEKSNQELLSMKKQHESEMARLTAKLKHFEIKNDSLMEALSQKTKECEQLSSVCDEFIGNV